MNKRDLVLRLANRFPTLTQKDVDVSVSLVLRAIERALASGRRLEVRCFGVLSVHRHAEKRARNPRTGEPVFVPARRAVHFRPGKRLRLIAGSSGNHALGAFSGEDSS